MKKRINLIRRQKKYYQIDALIRYVRIGIAVVGVIFLVTNLLFFIVLFSEQRNVTALSEKKKSLLQYLLQNKETEARFVFFTTKEKQVANILQGDVKFLPYYHLLSDSLKAASPSGSLKSVLIDKSRAVTFSIEFSDYPALLSFFKFMESDPFLKNFKDLTLSGISVGDQQNKGNFVLDMKGTFNEL